MTPLQWLKSERIERKMQRHLNDAIGASAPGGAGASEAPPSERIC